MIEIERVTIRSGTFRLEDLTLSVDAGRYAVLMGKTGSGKTTLLEALCGLRRVESGRIRIDGTDVTGWAPGDRGIGYVPQDLALFPTLTVRQHLEFALRLKRQSKAQIDARVREVSEQLGIAPLLQRRVPGLSGGERQRVALGRALSFRPAVLLLDEPLSALDEDTRGEMQQVLRQVKLQTGVTTLHVTHNRLEAEALADERLTLAAGRIAVAEVRDDDD